MFKQIILIMFKQIILNFAYVRNPCLRTPKYSHEYYLDMFILILRDLTSYSSIKRIYTELPEFHFKTINKKFLLWSRLHIFEDAYNFMLDKYISDYDLRIIDCFIDSSNIINKFGSELVSFGMIKKKKNY